MLWCGVEVTLIASFCSFQTTCCMMIIDPCFSKYKGSGFYNNDVIS